ncbi:MAG: hypothetical protein LBJ72_12615 [Dysgonamonadaceae bacterium]|jgi:PBP1b-binding outer membrane lipoprotein LpoB|nr:hypothetical protein [Dysgonamonadaceae bacterium]
MKIIIYLALFLLFLTGCRSTKQTNYTKSKQEVNSELKDSTVIREIKSFDVKNVPAESAKLEVTPEAITNLPTGAVFSGKQGRATVTLSKDEKGNINVTANCDSLQFVIENLNLTYERYVTQTNDSIASLNQQISTVVSLSDWDVFWIKMGKICGSILILTIIFFFVKWKLKH